MADDHRLSARLLDPGLKADLTQTARTPFGGVNAGCMISGIGGDARDGQELEQPVERSLPLDGEVIEHAR
jgi:hypothetical protein